MIEAARAKSVPAVAVVPLFDGAAHIGNCLDALLASDDARLRIVVVDDASRDEGLSIARERAAGSGGRITIFALERNHGFAGAINRGVAAALAEVGGDSVLALVNQDCIVSPGWLAPLAEALEDPRIAVAGARLYDADGLTLQHAGARIDANGLTTHFGRGSRNPSAWREPSDVDYVCGALMAVRASTWQRLGGLDEGYYPAYFEEVDFCVRAKRAGLRVVYVPGSEACHAEASASCGTDMLRRYHRNRLRFVVRQLLRERGAWAWLRAEAKWLGGRRRWREIAPVLAAYAALPRFVLELRTGSLAGASRLQTATPSRSAFGVPPRSAAAVRGKSASARAAGSKA